LNFSSNAILNAAQQRNDFPQLLASIPTFIPPSSNLLIEQQKQRDNLLLKTMAMANGRGREEGGPHCFEKGIKFAQN
jgi:hypothetical protein